MNIRVNGKNIEFFNDFNFTLRYNSVASNFDFRANFDPNNSSHRIVFRPLSYNSVVLEHNGELVLTGTILNHVFNIKSTKDLASFSGYSLPGVLEDCTIGLDQYPLEFTGLSLKQISEQLLQPFGLTLGITADAAAEADIVYSEVTADESQSIKAFLSELAFERGLILTHDSAGSLIITKTNVNQSPVTTFKEEKGVTEISLSVNGQAMHSIIFTQQQASSDEAANASESSISNPAVKAFRPTVKMQTSGDDNDSKKFNRSLIGAELRNISVNVKLFQWEWSRNGNLEIIRPNSVVVIQSPNNYLFEARKFFVESVTFIGNQKEQTAELKCVPIEAYSDLLDLGTIENSFDD